MKSRSFRARPRLRPVPYRVARLRERAVAAAALLCKQRRRRTSAPDAEWESWRGYAESLATNGASAAEEEEEEVVVVEEEVESSDGSPLLTALQCPKGGAVLLLTPAQKLTFTGKCQMICLYGCVEVFGFIISQGQPEYSLFSPHTHSALTIEAMSHKQPDKKKKNTRMEARAILKHYLPLVSRRTLMKKFSPECSIVLLTSLEDWITSFILSHQDYASIFATKQKERHYCVVPRDPALKAIGIEQLQADCGHVMSESSILATEELVQACVGPPFTHQREPHKMVYYGETSCEHDLERYIETVKYMLCFCKREAPLVVNTMGWVKGFGLMLLIDIIRLLSPSHIVQLSVKDVEDLAPLTPEYVQSATGLHTKGKLQVKHKSLGLMGAQDPEQQEEGKDGLRFQMSTGHKLLCVQSNFRGVGDPGSVRCHSSILRDLATLSYLSKMQPVELEQLIPIHSLIPYQVPFNAVALWTIHSDVAPTHIMYTVNASWVGLCRILEDFRYQLERPILLTQTPVCDCLGFGIVRGIDMEKKMYHILTPVAPEKLRLVNCLLVGSITIPHSIFKNQPGIKGEAPYVTSAYSFEISGAGKIKVNKQLKRREHQRTH
ncbi:polynucleotide 5'-hydroxyl-kinase NOL9 isoform X2 [Rhinatrema bivittatum]|uniref:polynucleotide 5'-hydroxyl-kinase NOL9 isoform X2 n=1 Tax=Rhinatrema bivittatum TaxID=194408 RepID=UPI00112B4E7F|nr:polynucleotide 5'-hydroxyl-kinase NOL9 isoform X2 [Rhinatrema bivittatum]